MKKKQKEGIKMTKEEKYIMTRMASNLYMQTKGKIGIEYVESEACVQWCVYNEMIKKENDKMRALFEQSRNGMDIEKELDAVYQQKQDYCIEKIHAESQLHISEKGLSSQKQIEKYVFERMAVLLSITSQTINDEVFALISWYTFSENEKKINKKISEQYRKSRFKNSDTSSLQDLMNEKNKIQAERFKYAAILNKIAHANGNKATPLQIASEKKTKKKTKGR